MKFKFLLSTLTCIVWTGLSAPSTAQVPAIDPHAIPEEAANLQLSVKELGQTVKHMEESVKGLMDLGSFLDSLLDVNRLFPSQKSKLSDTPKKAIPTETASDSSPAGQAKAAVESVTGGSDKDKKFADANTVSEAIKNNMQIVEEDENGVCGQGVAGVAGSIAGSMGGSLGGLGGSLLGGGGALTGTTALQKRKQVNMSKQMFSHYSLATGLVNRTMAYRTLSGAKKKTQEKVNSAQNMRQVHTAKTAGQETMAETYNRLLFSQAVSNAMGAFKAMDQTEGKISIGFPDSGELGGLNGITKMVPGL